MFELLFLLLPIAVAYGWVMGRKNLERTVKEKQLETQQELSRSVTLLLNNEQDQALDQLLRYFDNTPSTFET
jgi:lipopolysaccharide biosynthesis regulator YciM